MEKYKKIVDMTYFTKTKEINIDDALNKIVYLEVDSPLNYGIKTWNYYGRIIKITNCFFEIIEYCDGCIDHWKTNYILKKDQTKHSKKWAKKNIQKLYEVTSEEKKEEIEYYKN